MAATGSVRWLAVDRSVRRRVTRAVRRGDRVTEPGDAPVAVGYAEASLEWLAYRRRLMPFYLLLAVVLLLRGLIAGRWYLASFSYPLVGFAFVKIRTPAWRRKLSDALHANAALAADLPPVRIELPGRSWLGPGRRRRWLVIGLSGAVVLLVWFSVALAGVIRTDARWAAEANRICVEERAQLHRLGPRPTLERRLPIQREALVALGGIPRSRTPLESRLLDWRRYEIELGAWIAANPDDPRVPAERADLAHAHTEAQAVARRTGASSCAGL